MSLGGQIFFRVDGGVRLGMGHLFKSVILADRITKDLAKVSVYFFIKKDRRGVEWLKSHRYPVFVMPSSLSRAREPFWMMRKFPFKNKGVVALDLLDVSRGYVEAFKKRGFSVITFENRASGQRVADITFNGIVDGIENRITRFKTGGLLFRGAGYRIFSPEYDSFKRLNGSDRREKTLLISLGGGADYGFSKKLLVEISKRKERTKVIFVRGPAQKKLKYPKDSRVQIMEPRRSLVSLLQKADVAITAGGGTLYELAYGGVPGVALAKVKHQERNIKKFAQRGTVIPAGLMKPHAAKRAVDLAFKLLNNIQKRREMSRAGRNLVDGKGTKRVAEVVERLLKGVS